jgi:thiosulfate dehydrogenase (quinone) large subunit
MTTHRLTSPPATDHPELAELPGSMLTRTASQSLAVLRVAMGFVFLWAFFDKTFGWHYSTGAGVKSKAWIDGGSPTKGFLSNVEVGPFQSWFRSIAGDTWADWLFMLALLGIGLALLSGVALRIAAVCGVALMALMWFAEFPFAQHDSTGALTGSSNPLVDYHLIYAIVLVVLAFTYAGNTWGLGKYWAKLPLVHKNRWLL